MKLNLKWFVYRHDINSKRIIRYNVFNHWRFEEDVKKDLKKCNSKEEFAERLKTNLMSYFWGKCEYEVVITSFPVRIKKEELNRLNERFTKDSKDYGREPYGVWVRPDVGAKIDIYDQIDMNFEQFLNYVWSCKQNKK